MHRLHTQMPFVFFGGGSKQGPSKTTFKGAFAPERRKIAGHPELFFFKVKQNVSNLFCCSSNSAFLNLHIISFRTSRLTSDEND